MEDFYRRWLQLQHPNIPEAPNEEQSRSESPSTATDIVYETPELKLIVEKGVHRRQKIFRIQDHMFYIKILPKGQPPMLSSILDFLHSGFIHMLDQIKHFYKPNDHNTVYMTLTQAPMINGLSTGGYDLQSQDAAAEMVDRLLSMLWQYLQSNQSLVLNDTFQVYMKVLSVDHMKHCQKNLPR
ncbi:MAG: hypothetical protein FJ333_05720 [Sphingomonadales bacterium]|nr:hypothetical protein [Sphingomonadales bacterium]